MDPMPTLAIDAAARELVEDVKRGRMTEHDARNEIGQMLYNSTIAIEVARSYMKGRNDMQTLEDLADDLRLFIWEKARGIANERSGGWTGKASSVLDLELIANGKSVCGWARELMKARPWFIESKKARKAQHESLTRGDVTVEGIIDAMGGDESDWERIYDDEVQDAVLNNFGKAMKSRRRSDAYEVHVKARAVEQMYGLAKPRRLNQEESDILMANLDSGDTWAQGQVRRLIDCVEAGEDPHMYGIDPNVIALLGSFDPAGLEAMNRDPRTADAILRSAATPQPALSGPVERGLRKAVSRLCTRNKNVDLVVRTYIDMTAELDSDDVVKTQAVRREERAAFEKAAENLVESGTSRLGTNASDIERTLRAMVATIEVATSGMSSMTGQDEVMTVAEAEAHGIVF